ncbi:hypothetical protein FO519_008393 [Halicephalobus sp. NKZ332]|nr:hypothetical protein FO519_008393 [Halicephalobus sp. NKZ332]
MQPEERCSAELLFRSVAEQEGVFYKAQSRDEPELEYEQKLEILRNLFETRPSIFLQRYHQFVSPCFIGLFDEEDYVTNFYIKLIKERIESKVAGTKVAKKEKNQRYLQLLKLKEDGNYFSNEKMRERAPVLFDSMVGQYLDDEEKLHLRPTVDRPEGTWSNMLEQFDDSGRVSSRRKRQLAEDWEMPCSSKEAARFITHAGSRITKLDDCEKVEGLDEEDEEVLRETYPKHCSKEDLDAIMKKFRKTTVEIENPEKNRNWGSFEEPSSFDFKKIEEEEDIKFEKNEDEDSEDAGSDIDEYPKELLKSEFMSIMERRILLFDEDVENLGTMNAQELISESITEMKDEEFDEYPTRWYYLGEDNQVHGPFTNTEMIRWVDSGYFTDQLMIRTERDEKFYTLFDYIQFCNGSPFRCDVYSMDKNALNVASFVRQRNNPLPTIRIPMMIPPAMGNVSTHNQFPIVNGNGFPVPTGLYVNAQQQGFTNVQQQFGYVTERENPSSSSVSDSPDIDRCLHIDDVQTEDKCVSTDDAPWLQPTKVDSGTDTPTFDLNVTSSGVQTQPVMIKSNQVARLLKELTGVNFQILR